MWIHQRGAGLIFGNGINSPFKVEQVEGAAEEGIESPQRLAPALASLAQEPGISLQSRGDLSKLAGYELIHEVHGSTHLIRIEDLLDRIPRVHPELNRKARIREVRMPLTVAIKPEISYFQINESLSLEDSSIICFD